MEDPDDSDLVEDSNLDEVDVSSNYIHHGTDLAPNDSSQMELSLGLSNNMEEDEEVITPFWTQKTHPEI